MDRDLESRAAAKFISRLDKEHSQYQELHRKYYGHDDERAKYLHRLKVATVESLLEEIRSEKGS